MENKILKYSNIIKKQLTISKTYLSTLDGDVCHDNDLLNWFKGLCSHFTKLIVLLTNYHKIVDKDVNYKETLLLYLHQLITLLSVLIDIFVRESEVDIQLPDIRLFCKKQMLLSLDGIEQILSKRTASDSFNANFIKWMDSALDKLIEIDYVQKKDQALHSFDEAKGYFEEVLSHAMSIAQVTLPDDYKKIRGSSQSVLEGLENLTTEIKKDNPNIAMLNLFIDTCIKKLCALERKVNTAVLNLSLRVFSDYTKPLETLHNYCFNKANSGKQEELDNLIVDFDLHVDRILQIGLFAISCSSSTSNCVKIRSCMASLEALETELVPAFTSVLLDLNLNNIQFALLLKEHWINQAVNLQKLIYLIIDPFAFCEIIWEENKLLVENISENVKEKSTFDTDSFKKLLATSKVLADFVTVVLEEEQESNAAQITKALSDFKSVFHEVKSAYDVLPNETTSFIRILKRCKILLTCTKTLWKSFMDENTENENPLVNGLKLSENSHDVSPKQVFGNVFLDHIVARGKEILEDRSILYRTTTKDKTFQIPRSTLHKRQDNSMKASKLSFIRNNTFTVANTSNTELQMTDILKELNNLTNTTFGRRK